MTSGNAAGRLSAATYNIHKCVGRDGHHRPERTFAVLRELDADVLGIQEFDSRPRRRRGPITVGAFEEALGDQALAQPTMTAGGGFHGNLLLTRLPILASREIRFGSTGFERRGALLADLEVAGGPVRVVVTHLGLLPGIRRRQAARLVAEMAADDDRPLVLLGDLNEWLPRGGCLGILGRHFPQMSCEPTWPAARPLIAYDRVGAGGGAARLEAARVPASPLALEASDHLPLRAEVVWHAAAVSGRSPEPPPRAGSPPG